jgi:nicotinic acid mononucleotide adenylyltransferase
MKNVLMISGGFDPVHDGHVELFEYVVEKYNQPITLALNSDAWLERRVMPLCVGSKGLRYCKQ